VMNWMPKRLCFFLERFIIFIFFIFFIGCKRYILIILVSAPIRVLPVVSESFQSSPVRFKPPYYEAQFEVFSDLDPRFPDSGIVVGCPVCSVFHRVSFKIEALVYTNQFGRVSGNLAKLWRTKDNDESSEHTPLRRHVIPQSKWESCLLA
jgi:hypothetical protein